MAKGKPQPLRRHFSAGGVVFRPADKKIEWLVTKAAQNKLTFKGAWRLPKGWLDETGDHRVPGPLTRGERKANEAQLEKAALKEVEEEGGVKAQILAKLGTQRYFSVFAGERVLKFTTFYLMKWERDLAEGPDWETAVVEWLPFEVAYKRLAFSHEKEILAKAKELLEQGTQETLV